MISHRLFLYYVLVLKVQSTYIYMMLDTIQDQALKSYCTALGFIKALKVFLKGTQWNSKLS